MTNLLKAAEMALKFCEDIGDLGGPYPYVNETAVVSDSRKVLQALRQALAQDALKTVADIDHSIGLFVDSPSVDAVTISEKRVHKTDKSIHEPVAYEFIPNGELLYPHELERRPDANYVPLYTAPPKKEWVGLTDGEREFFKGIGFVGVDIIEAKLKEKNT